MSDNTSQFRGHSKAFSHFFLGHGLFYLFIIIKYHYFFLILIIKESSLDVKESIFSVEELIENLETTVLTYFKLNDLSTKRFHIHVHPITGVPMPATLELYLKENINIDNDRTIKHVHNLTRSNPLGPFSAPINEIKKIMHTIDSFTVNFLLSTSLISKHTTNPYSWKVKINYHRVAGEMVKFVTTEPYHQYHYLLIRIAWISMLVLTVATLSFVLGINALIDSFYVYFNTKRRFNAISFRHKYRIYAYLKVEDRIKKFFWRDIPFYVKLDFFSLWDIFVTFSEGALIVSLLFTIFYDHAMLSSISMRIITGICCFIQSANIINYLDSWKGLYTLALTLQYAASKNLPFIVSVVPLFLGFAGCGYIMFSPISEHFLSTDRTSLTLFALLCGDLIKDFFENLQNNFKWIIVSRIYLYTFVTLFITAIMKLFIRMMEDSYNFAQDFILLKEERHSRRIRNIIRNGIFGQIIKRDFDFPLLFDLIEGYEGMLVHDDADHSILKKQQKIEAILEAHKRGYINETERSMRRVMNRSYNRLVEAIHKKIKKTE